MDIQQKEMVCRTLHQYNKEPIPHEDMKKLKEIAEDYRRVKNYVYSRYSGIGSLPKLYPGYTVQNEMTQSGLREELAMPSVYFYRAVFDALGDIKSQWARTKKKLLQLISQNGNFTAEEKHYLRFLIKTGNAFEAVLNQNPVRLPQEIQLKHEELTAQINTEKLHKYLCRQVRKYHIRNLYTDKADGFLLLSGLTGMVKRITDTAAALMHQGRAFVITYGTFDLFHEGHYRLLKRAKELGDYLIVGVTTEAYDKARG